MPPFLMFSVPAYAELHVSVNISLTNLESPVGFQL